MASDANPLDSSPGNLTTFPVAFPEDEEKGQVNQVISSLFRQVKNKLGAYGGADHGPRSPLPLPEELGGLPPSTSSSSEKRHEPGIGLGLEMDIPDSSGNNHRQIPSGTLQIPNSGQSRSNFESPALPHHDLFEEDRSGSARLQADYLQRDLSKDSGDNKSYPSSTSSHNARPNLSRTVTSSQPAPPMLSTTPIIRTRDFANAGPESSYSPDYSSTGMPLTRSRTNSMSRIPHPHMAHQHSNSASSSSRYRRPSFSTPGVCPSPSSSLSAFALEQLDYSNVPGFPIADDARSVRTVETGTGGVDRKDSVTKIIRRLRGEGLNKTYWMADENCKECYDCKSIFSTWRRKHHCRICGQIFCSRCAPNIIKGHRFGHDGMVRVCNLCLEIMDEYDDEDDRRSVTSNSTSHIPHSATHPSPFAASHLFSRQPEQGLHAISEQRWNDAEDDPRLVEPIDQGSPSKTRRRHPLLDFRSAPERNSMEAAPFRRTIIEDEHDVPPHSGTTSLSESPNDVGERPDMIVFPSSDEAKADNVIETSSAQGAPRTRLSSRVSNPGLSGVLLNDLSDDGGVWKSRQDSMSYPHDALPPQSLDFFKQLLHQLLEQHHIPHQAQWENVLLSILLHMSIRVAPEVHMGESISVLNYVKVKKIPGGRVTQSEYVDGVVITKNLAHKQMPRHMINPRIMILTFPLDYHRVDNQFVSLEPLLAQEKNYLRHLTKRVIDLRPHIVLVEKTVSRIALNFLLDARVSVARGIKLTALRQVARCTQADVIGSMDRLALEPRLGRCTELKVQTFEHPLIPGGRKTYMRFEGCNDELGCTIVLRGADEETLRQVKRVTEFLSSAVYNLRLEASLFYDEFNLCPFEPTEQINAYKHLLPLAATTDEASSADQMSETIRKHLNPYINTLLSTSVAVRYPPPAPLARLGHLDTRLRHLRQLKDEAEAELILYDEKHAKEASSASSVTVKPDMVPIDEPAREEVLLTDGERVLHKPSEVKIESDIIHTEYELSEQLKFWNWYNSRYHLEPKPETLQKIIYSVATVVEGSDKPCSGPTLLSRDFYGNNDCTLGQYLEALALHAGQPCPNKACTRIMLHHFQVLVHGDTRLQIAMDQFLCPSIGNEDNIITWSYCKICKAASPTSIIKDDTWRFSWAKYLEHSFYPPKARGGFSCSHDIYRDQIRYFGIHHLAIRIHNEPITIYDVVRPTLQLQIRQETRVLLKNQEYEVLLAKSVAFFESVIMRMKTFDETLVESEKLEDLKSSLQESISRAQEDRREIVDELIRTYRLSAMTDVLSLNKIYQILQERVVRWDNELQELEKMYLPSEKDIRRMTAATLKRLFASPDALTADSRNVSGTNLSEVGDGEFPKLDAARQPGLEPNPEAISKLESPTLDDAQGSADDAETPMAERSASAFTFPPPLTPDKKSNKSYDSDSTISGVPANSGGLSSLTPTHVAESSASGHDSDANFRGFISRLPRRSLPAPSVAELVRRFQLSPSPQDVDEGEQEHFEEPIGRSDSLTESDSEPRSRPRYRSRKSEGDVIRSSRQSNQSGGVFSDGERSYAANASRIPTVSLLNRETRDRTHRLRQQGVDPPSTRKEGDFVSNRIHSSVVKAQRKVMAKVGKGKAPTRQGTPDRPNSPAPHRRGHFHTGSRVTTIARHFDKLSREAERDRQRKMLIARGRAPRPVMDTKVQVQVFSNLRDAFKDDSDSSGSSEADDENEEDDAEGEESANEQMVAASRERKPARQPTAPLKDPKSMAVDVRPAAEERLANLALTPVSMSPSDTSTDVSMQGRLQITLPPFETTTPLLTVPPTPFLNPIVGGEAIPVQSYHASQPASDVDTGSATQERSSILKTLSGLWAFRTGDIIPLEYPLGITEHIFADSKIVVREDEPTSIIAFALSSKTHRDKMRGIAHQTKTMMKQEQAMDAQQPAADPSSHDRSMSWDKVSSGETSMPESEDFKRDLDSGTHLNYDFESGSSTFFCRIFFAGQFANLRSACGCEESFLDSLARCIKWDSSGGKSGSAFLKTKDDRLIAKEVSRLEMDAMTKFAPSYFEYMRQSTQHNRPTALAKIYGFFKVGYKNAATGKATKMNLLIMENLFYERRFEKIYDLKGSMRNRMVQVTGRENEVLLDENLMEIAHRQPLFLRDHSKVIFRTALWNDTLFLSSLDVMDYSLVVGVDADRKELVVGIVDYIRTFTWDKKLESWVKDLGGAGRGEPTIVTPKQYKARFRAAMDRYFPAVPDRWSRMPSDSLPVDEEAAQSLTA